MHGRGPSNINCSAIVINLKMRGFHNQFFDKLTKKAPVLLTHEHSKTKRRRKQTRKQTK